MAHNYTGSLTFGSATIKVSPDILIAKADEVESGISRMRQLFSNVKSSIDRTASYWEGEAGDLHRRAYLKRQAEVEEMLKKLRQRVNELEQLAASYTDAERANTSAANALATNVIQ